MDSKVEFVKAG